MTPQVYVYGVIPADAADTWSEITAVAGPQNAVRTVSEGDLAALVSDLPTDHTPGRPADVEAHRRVLSQAIQHGTTVPMRFGIVMDGDAVVRERLLIRHAAELRDLLARLEGNVQMMVKAYYAEDALLRDALASDPDLAQAATAVARVSEAEAQAERVQVGERVAAAVDAQRAAVESALLEALSPVAEAIQVDPPGGERVALSAQVLVARDSRAALDQRVSELGDALAGVVGFRYVGPLPPYSFADVSLDDDGDAWD